jgi:capsular exopolysaccharide synthesis family protein
MRQTAAARASELKLEVPRVTPAEPETPPRTDGEPALTDYLAALWRRRVMIVATTLLVALFAALAVPALTHRTRTSQASVRIQVAGTVAPAATARTTARGAGRYADLGVMATSLTKLGTSAGSLSALQGRDRGTWPSTALARLNARPVAGTTLTTLTFSDERRAVANRLLGIYAAEWTKAYNTRASAESKRQLAAFQEQADSLGAQVLALALQADTERLSPPAKAVSTKTATDLKLATTRYEVALAQIDRVHAADISRGTPANVVSAVSSSVVGRPVRRGVLLLSGLLLGLFAGIGLAFVAEALRGKVVTPEEVANATGFRVLATVPARGRARSGITVAARPFGPAAEGYQRARAVLQLKGVGEDVRTLAVLGAEAAAGKSTLAVNLATSLARLGRPVVLVSADLRQPRIDRLYGVEGKPGLADLLLAEGDPDPSMALVRIDDELCILPAGTMTDNPAELLGRPAFARILARLAPMGAVIIDTPPGLWSGEAMAAAAAADASVIVARAGHTSRVALRTLALDLRHNDLNCIGAVLVGSKRPPGNPRPSYYLPPGGPRFGGFTGWRHPRGAASGLADLSSN